MEDMINQYKLLAPFQNKNAGFSRWTYAVKEGKTYFLKEFLNPVYPMGDSISSALQKQRIKDCQEYQDKKKRLYEAIHQASDGNLIQIHEFFRYDSHYYIATQRIDAQKLSPEDVAALPAEQRVLLCKTIAHGVKKLHEAHVVHADIKETNILLKQTKTGNLVGKLIDFDCSFFENAPPQSEDELGGDQVYLAPEACQFICGEEAELTCKLDVFALGILFHQYFTGKMPGFDTSEYDYAFEAVLDDQELILSQKLPQKLRRMIGGMLEQDPKKRLSMDQVFNILDKKEEKKAPEEKKIKAAEVAAPTKEPEKEPEVSSKKEGWFFTPGDL